MTDAQFIDEKLEELGDSNCIAVRTHQNEGSPSSFSSFLSSNPTTTIRHSSGSILRYYRLGENDIEERIEEATGQEGPVIDLGFGTVFLNGREHLLHVKKHMESQ